jgi:hypothetical protein
VRALAARLDRPLWVGLLVGIAAGGFAALRVLVAGHGNIADLILLGSAHVNASHLPRPFPVLQGQGYDGQFYFRLALDPLDFKRTAYGITLDSPERLQRVAYPMLAWLFALGGRANLVPWSLVGVNVVGLGILGGLGAAVAKDQGRHCLWGLLVCGYFGFLWSISRDTTEIVASLFLVAGLLAIRRRRPYLAGLALSVAVLSRETALIAVGCIGAVWLAQRLHLVQRGSRIQGSESPLAAPTWIIPVLVFVGWQVLVHHSTGTFPLLSSGQHNFGPPFVGFAKGFNHYVHALPSVASALWFGELVLLLIVVGTVISRFHFTPDRAHEQLAWLAFLVLAVCLASGIWLGDVGFRSLDDLWIMSSMLLLTFPRRLVLLAPLVTAAMMAVFVELVLYL